MVEDNSSDEHMGEDADDCDHSFVLKDDLGYVCRVCGVIDRGIETIIDVQFNKVRSWTFLLVYTCELSWASLLLKPMGFCHYLTGNWKIVFRNSRELNL